MANNGGAAATDLCGNGVTWTNNTATAAWSGAACANEITVEFYATDSCGNTATTTATFIINDTTEPSFVTEADDATGECQGTNPYTNTAYLAWLANNGGATATDLCGNGVNWTNNSSTPVFSGGCTGNSINIAFYATDACGNTATTIATFTINDTTAPTVSSTNSANDPDIDNFTCNVVTPIALTTTSGSCNVERSIARPTWVDACGGSVVRTQSIDNGGNIVNLGDQVLVTLYTGTTVVTFNGTDCALNTGTCTLTFEVTDGQAPTINGCPITQTGLANDAGMCSKSVSLVTPVYADNCGVISIEHSIVSNGGTPVTGDGFLSTYVFPVGTTTVTYTVGDGLLTSACTFTIGVNDTQKPVAVCATGLVVALDASGNGSLAANLAAGMSTDNCSVASSTSPMVPVTCDSIGVNTVTLTVTDASSNATTTACTFTVVDNLPPVAPTLADANGTCTITVSAPTTFDNCGGSITGTTSNPTTYNSATAASYVITWTFADGNGNSITANQNVILSGNVDAGTTTADVCDTYTWAQNGQTYTATGIYTQQVGCDVFTLNLTIRNSTAGSQNVDVCDTYTWAANSMTYTTSGVYTATLTNAAGCDSTATLNLTIRKSTAGSQTLTVCSSSYTWPANSMTYTTTGVYTATLTNAAGCDSTATLNLTITPAPIWYVDADNDGFGSTTVFGAACTQPVGTSANNTDCIDTNPAANPSASEICNNGIDDNCDGITETNSPCVAPSITQLVTVAGSSATFNWTAGCYKRYRLQRRPTAISQWDLTLINNTNANTFTLNNLAAGTYQWALRGDCFSGVNLWSPLATGTNFTIGANNLVTNNTGLTGTTEVVAYPNPVRDVLHVDVMTPETVGSVYIRLTDNLGRTLYGTEVNNAGAFKHHISMEEMVNGMYFLQVIPQGQAAIVKPVVLNH